MGLGQMQAIRAASANVGGPVRNAGPGGQAQDVYWRRSAGVQDSFGSCDVCGDPAALVIPHRPSRYGACRFCSISCLKANDVAELIR
jgi:hypothetical protein